MCGNGPVRERWHFCGRVARPSLVAQLATYNLFGFFLCRFPPSSFLVRLLAGVPMAACRPVGPSSHSQPREALFADLAAKLAAGPPTQPVGLVKQQEGPWEPAAGEAGEAEKKLGGLLKESLSPKGDDK